MRRLSRALSVGLLLLAIDSPGRAQPAPAGKAALAEGNPALARKVAGPLLEARRKARLGQPIGAPIAVPGSPLRGLPLVRESRPRVDLKLDGMTPATIEHLKEIGVEVLAVHWRHGRVDARVDLDLLDELAAVPEVALVRPDYGRIALTGSVTSEGDASTNSDGARAAGSTPDGTGVTVGILSDSFNDNRGGTESGGVCDCTTFGNTCSNVVTGMTNQGTGDLPTSVTMLDDFTPGGDEGAAMGEIVHDLAPGAAMMYHTAFNSLADFADGVTELANCGADVIVDDVFWFGEAMFQDDLIAQAVQEVVEMGVIYHSSAGNQATWGVDQAFRDVVPGTDDVVYMPTPTGNDFHDFDGAGDTFAKFRIPGSPNAGASCQNTMEGLPNCCGVRFVLQWSEPFSSLDDPALPVRGAQTDLDLYACTSPSAANCTVPGATPQGCGTTGAPTFPFGPVAGDPIETFDVFNLGGTPVNAYLAVESFCDDGSGSLPHFRIATFPTGICGSAFPGNFDFEDGDNDFGGTNPDAEDATATFTRAQTYGHAAAKGAVAVAATRFDEFDSGGTAQGEAGVIDVEPFSSLGGALPFYFDGVGAPLPTGPESAGPGPQASPPAPETRQKPEITGPDGVANTFFAGGTFFGTSASAPHTAAVAALLKELADNLSPAGSLAVLEGGATDIEGAGADDLSGAGFVDAKRSASVIDLLTTPLVANLVLDLRGGDWVNSTAGALVPARATTSITFRNGDFSNVQATAPLHIFADGFESGDTASWSN